MRVGEKEISEQAAIVERYRDLFSPGQLDVLREAEERSERRRARAALPAAQDVRGRDRRRRAAPRARTSSRTGSWPRASTGAARRCRCGLRRRSSPCCPPTATATSSARSRTPSAPASTTTASSCSPPARRSRPSSPASPTRSRGTREEKGISLHELERALDAASRASTAGVRPAARTLVREAARPGAGGGADLEPHELPAPALAARGRRTRRSVPSRSASATLAALGFDLERNARHPARPGRPPAEVAARLRDRLRSAERRPPDHARPGRPARLPGASCTRPATRSTTRASIPQLPVHVPQALARPRADRDLLVHRRGDLARARLARRALRPLRRAGSRERRGDDLPRGAALPPLRGEAAVRARVLGPLRGRRRHDRRATPSG